MEKETIRRLFTIKVTEHKKVNFPCILLESSSSNNLIGIPIITAKQAEQDLLALHSIQDKIVISDLFRITEEISFMSSEVRIYNIYKIIPNKYLSKRFKKQISKEKYPCMKCCRLCIHYSNNLSFKCEYSRPGNDTNCTPQFKLG